MNLKEIINRTSPMTYTLEEQCFVIEEYIYEKKGKRIKCNPFRDVQHLPEQVLMVVGRNILQQVNSAFNDALEYYLNK